MTDNDDNLEKIRLIGDDMNVTNNNIEKLRVIGESLIDPEFFVQLFELGYPDAVIVVDMDGYIKIVNNHLELLFGYHRSELYDKPIEMLLPESSRAAHVQHRKKYELQPRARPMGLGMKLQGRHKTGREFGVEISLSPVIVRQGAFVVATIRVRRDESG